MTNSKKPSNEAPKPSKQPISGGESHGTKATNADELAEEQLENVAGGVSLAQACATGKHIGTGTV